MIETIKAKLTPPIGENPRNNNFNMVRFFAAVLVIYGHMAHIAGVPVFSVLNVPVSTLGVKIFFIISGYLITESYLRDSNIIRYSIRRFFRIIPGLAFLILLSVFVLGPIFTTLSRHDYFANSMTYDYLRNIALNVRYALPGVFEANIYPNAVNGSLWSLPAEVAMYGLLPILVAVFKKLHCMKIGLISAFIFFVGLNIVRTVYYPEARLVIYGTNWMDAIPLIPFFFAGSLVTLPKVKKLLNLQWATAFVVFAAVFSFNALATELVLTAVLPYLVFSFGLASKPVFGSIFTKNDYSYGLYLYGFVVQQCVMVLLGKYAWSMNTYFVISCVGSLLFAVVSWHLVEKPCQKFGKWLLKQKGIAKR